MNWAGYRPPIGTDRIPVTGPVRTFRALYCSPSSNTDRLLFESEYIGERGNTEDIQDWMITHLDQIQEAVYAAEIPPYSWRWGEYRKDNGVFQFSPLGREGYMFCVAYLEEI